MKNNLRQVAINNYDFVLLLKLCERMEKKSFGTKNQMQNHKSNFQLPAVVHFLCIFIINELGAIANIFNID